MEIKAKQFINKGDKSLKKTNTEFVSKDKIAYGLIGMATIITVGVLVFIIGFIFANGIKKVNFDFFVKEYESKTFYAMIPASNQTQSNKLGIILEEELQGKEKVIMVKDFEKNSLVSNAKDLKGNKISLKKKDIISKIGVKTLKDTTVKEANSLLNQNKDSFKLKIVRSGGGVFQMLVTTIFMIVLTLAIACPIGIFAAIYLTEYAKPGRVVNIIRFATESLAGIPSIIYGLFGMIFFVTTLKMGYSLLAGAMTLSIILLPVIIRQTEESLKAVPQSFREASLGLGANKLQTIWKAVLPSAVPGIIVAIILSIGRIVGESAALLLTAGTVAKIPDSIFAGASTLTVKAYTIAKEEGNIEMACAIGTVIIVVILVLNSVSKIVARKYSKI